MLDKVAWRKQSRELRNRFYEEALKSGSLFDVHSALVERLSTILPESGVWAVYQPMGSEADPLQILEKRNGIDWVFPRVETDSLVFYRPSSEPFKENKWGVKEPAADQADRVDMQEIDGFIIPGLAFDRKGGRLGQGKGYYDKTLAGLSATKIGIGYSVQLMDSIPMEAHDAVMDYVVTDEAIYSMESRKYVEGKAI